MKGKNEATCTSILALDEKQSGQGERHPAWLLPVLLLHSGPWPWWNEVCDWPRSQWNSCLLQLQLCDWLMRRV